MTEDAAFQNITHAELSSYLADVDCLAFVAEGGVSGPAIVGNSTYWGSSYGRFGPTLDTPNNKLFAFSVSD